MFCKTGLLVSLLLTILAACNQVPTPETTAPSQLAPMFGSTSRDEAHGLASHSSGVYVVGNVGGNTFIRKSDASGSVLWDKYIFGSVRARGVASDPLDNAYVAGIKYRDDDKILIRKYAEDSGVAWTRQISNKSRVGGIAVDRSGNVYLLWNRLGSYFLSRYNTSGTHAWTRFNVLGNDVAVDHAGNIYVAGSDMSLRKFSPHGSLLWTRHATYNQGYGTAVAVSGNHVYLVGNYLWRESPNEWKVAVTKYNPDGVQQWSRPYGLNGSDHAWDASADGNGNLYFAGYRVGGPHSQSVGYVAKFSPDFHGRELWTKYIDAPAPGNVFGFAVVVRPLRTSICIRHTYAFCNQIYTAGYTFKDLGAGYNGEGDAYLRRLNSDDGSTVWTR